jgi:uncharacterized protein (DUF1330 family)
VLEGDATQPDTVAILQFLSMVSLRAFIEADEYQPYREAWSTWAGSVMYGLDA